ncbi:MAG TPA: DUF2627 domain-containing protein [Bacillota bacterium]|nr:DUF2627 domain-containing protein [Bacillota bacterium]
MARFIAVMLLLIPGFIAAFGIKLMRDTMFADYYPFLINNGIQFVVGFIMFIAGTAFIGGFILHRDRKKGLVKNKRLKGDSK